MRAKKEVRLQSRAAVDPGQSLTEESGDLGTVAAKITLWDATLASLSELNQASLPSASITAPLQGTSHAAAPLPDAALLYRTSNTGKPLEKGPRDPRTGRLQKSKAGQWARSLFPVPSVALFTTACFHRLPPGTWECPQECGSQWGVGMPPGMLVPAHST